MYYPKSHLGIFLISCKDEGGIRGTLTTTFSLQVSLIVAFNEITWSWSQVISTNPFHATVVQNLDHFWLFEGVIVSAVGRESRDGKFPGIPGFFGFPFPGKRGPGSREMKSL